MGRNNQDRRALSKEGGRSGLSLTKFAQAKSSTYDKRARNDQLKALHARKASKYRRLKARLEKEGRLEPILREENEERADGRDGLDIELQRALKRAGPTLDEDGSDSDAVGAVSPSGSPEREEDASEDATKERQLGTASQNVAGNKAERALEESEKRKQTAHKGTDGKSEPKRKRKKKPKPRSQVQLLAAKVQAQKLRFVPQDKQQAEREKRQQEMEMRQERISEKEKQRKKEREAYLKKTKRGQPVMKHRVDKMLAKLQAELP